MGKYPKDVLAENAWFKQDLLCPTADGQLSRINRETGSFIALNVHG